MEKLGLHLVAHLVLCSAYLQRQGQSDAFDVDMNDKPRPREAEYSPSTAQLRFEPPNVILNIYALHVDFNSYMPWFLTPPLLLGRRGIL